MNDKRLEVRVLYRGVVQATRYLAPGARYLLGATKAAHAPMPAEGDGEQPCFELVSPVGDELVVNVTGRMTGEVTAGDELVGLEAWVAARGSSFVLPAGASLRLRWGELGFDLAETSAPEVVGPPPLVLKWSEQKYTAYSGLALLVTVFVLSLVPPDVKALAHQGVRAELRFSDFVITPPESPPPPSLPRSGAGGADKAGKRHAGPEGKLGDRRARETNARLAIAGPPENRDPRLARQQRESEIAGLGILGIIKRSEGDILASVFGHDSALGHDPTSVLGNLTSSPIGAAYGVGALGVKGTGAGGGGEGQGTIGLGVLGTIGGARGERAAGFGPGGGGRLAGRRATTPDFIAGQPVVRGSLDKDIIRRIIRQHLNEVKFCYEQELVRDADLAGRVAVNFTIVPSGKVAAAVVQSSTMGNPRVEGCLVGAVRRWEFPKPAGGGLVIATYPFNFMAAGRDR